MAGSRLIARVGLRCRTPARSRDGWQPRFEGTIDELVARKAPSRRCGMFGFGRCGKDVAPIRC
jgi:hypothetical protein